LKTSKKQGLAFFLDVTDKKRLFFSFTIVNFTIVESTEMIYYL